LSKAKPNNWLINPMQYRRAQLRGGTYFFTIVTFNRQSILTLPSNVSLLRSAFRYVKKRHPFSLEAVTVLPDPIHLMVTLPPGDNDYPMRIRMVKSFFSRKIDGLEGEGVPSRQNKKEKLVWQRRYWEHLISDNEDYANHMEYIHYNPVKHGLVAAPVDWRYSSFHFYVRQGIYGKDWGSDPMDFSGGVGSE
jgi:putative transposase